VRGRLIFPFRVDIARLDTDATADDPDGAGPHGLGYDDVFREPVMVPPADDDSSARGSIRRVESVVRLSAQIEDDAFDAMQMMTTGQSPRSMVRLVLHFRELEREGLLDDDGLPMLRKSDRLDAIYRPTGELIQRIPNPPGLFCVEPQPRSFFVGARRNLLLLMFESRERSTS